MSALHINHWATPAALVLLAALPLLTSFIIFVRNGRTPAIVFS